MSKNSLEKSDLEKYIERYDKMVRNYAKKKNYRLNPDEDRISFLVREMAKNKIEFGFHYCPCMLKRICGDPEEDRKRICPCYWHGKDISEVGFCECRLYYKYD